LKIELFSLLRTYKRSYLIPDFLGGVAEGLMAIPQGLAYATLIQLPPINGLYTGLVNPLFYLIFGACKEASVGVAAVEALFIFETVSDAIPLVGKVLSPGLIAKRARATVAVTLIAGLVQILMRFLKLGAVYSLLSDPVFSAFYCGIAFIITTLQLKHILSVNLLESKCLPLIWWDLFQQWRHGEVINWYGLLFTIVGLAALFCMKAISGRSKYSIYFPLPSTLLLLVFGSLIFWFSKLREPPFNLQTLDAFPPGLPSAAIPDIEEFGVLTLLMPSVKIGCMTYIISVSIAKGMGIEHDYDVDCNQELLAMGIVNLVGAFFQCYPTAVSSARTNLMSELGVKTPAHSLVCSGVLFLTVMLCTGAFRYIHMCLLSSVVLYYVYHFGRFREGFQYLTHHRLDFFFWAMTFIATITCGASAGVAVGVGVSLLWLLKKVSLPSTAILGRIPGTMVYRNVLRFPAAQTFPGIQILRIDSPLTFANKDFFKSKVTALARQPETQVIIIDASSINDLDCTAVRMLVSLAKKLEKDGVNMLFANWLGPQRDFLDKSGFHEAVPTGRIFLSLHDAVVHAQSLNASYINWSHAIHEEHAREKSCSFQHVDEVTPDGGEKLWNIICVENDPIEVSSQLSSPSDCYSHNSDGCSTGGIHEHEC